MLNFTKNLLKGVVNRFSVPAKQAQQSTESNLHSRPAVQNQVSNTFRNESARIQAQSGRKKTLSWLVRGNQDPYARLAANHSAPPSSTEQLQTLQRQSQPSSRFGLNHEERMRSEVRKAFATAPVTPTHSPHVRKKKFTHAELDHRLAVHIGRPEFAQATGLTYATHWGPAVLNANLPPVPASTFREIDRQKAENRPLSAPPLNFMQTEEKHWATSSSSKRKTSHPLIPTRLIEKSPATIKLPNGA
jgi:hypothetical protein